MDPEPRSVPTEPLEFFCVPGVHEYFETLRSIDRLDLLVLKAQVLVEHRLRHLLAFRMCASAEHVARATEKMPFAALVELVLCEPELEVMRKHLLILNNARVAVAHRLTTSEHERHIDAFIEAKRKSGSGTKTQQLFHATIKALVEIETMEREIADGSFLQNGAVLTMYVRGPATDKRK